ncbi:hypothetical protein ABK040_016432 [Willaertia magna]
MSGKPQAGDYTVEYSKSGRATCKLTNEKIPKGALRIGKIVQSQSFDGTYPIWYSFEDWVEDKKLVKQFQSTCKKVHGLQNLRMEDQERINKLLKGNNNSSESSDNAATGSSSSDNNNNLTEEQLQKKKEFEEENKKMWEIKDHLRNVPLKLLKGMLTENGQIEKGGEDLVIERCAQGMMFGNIPGCPHEDCEGGYITYSGGKFKCHGKLEWAKCDYTLTVDEAFEKAEDWIIPEDIDEEYIQNFEFKKLKKCDYQVDNTVTIKQSDDKEENDDKEKDDDEDIDPEKEKLPLGNFKIALSGKLSMKQNELAEIIDENGGTFMKDVTKKCTHLVCTENEYKKDTTKVKKAKKLNLLILDEDWIHMSIEKEKKLDEDEYKDYVLFNPEDKKRKKNDNEEEEEEGNEKVPKKKKVTIKGRAAVDTDCEKADDVHVLEIGDDVYSVHLNLTDLQTNINSYYILQVLEHDKKNKYYVFRKWGRLNSDIGSHKLTKYGTDKYGALDEFEKMYKDKTGNEWTNRKNFEKKPGRFFPIDVDYGSEETNLDNLSEQLSKDYKGKLHPEVADLIKLIFDVQTMKQTLKEMEIDTDKMPLGKLKKSHIDKGYQVLNEIQDLLKIVREREKEEGMVDEDDNTTTTQSLDVNNDNNNDGNTSATPPTVVEEKKKEKKPPSTIHQQHKRQFLTLSNKFYTIIPTSNPEIIDDEETLKEKIKMIEALQEMEIATSLLKTNGSEDNEEDPLDGYYKKLHTNLSPLLKSSDMFKMCNDYLQNTHASTHREYSLELLDAFEVDREGEFERYKSSFNDLHNRQLLWHGSRVSNFVGILSQGLRIAPPEAPATGYMFGKGIYFADMSSKSANYCRTSLEANVGVLLLCEVALGNMYERLQADYIEKLPKGYHSCFGHGKTEPDDSMAKFVDDGKLKVPLGLPSKSNVPRHASLLYNEYIVYDIAQVRIRYLLKVKFNYKRGYY